MVIVMPYLGLGAFLRGGFQHGAAQRILRRYQGYRHYSSGDLGSAQDEASFCCGVASASPERCAPIYDHSSCIGGCPRGVRRFNHGLFVRRALFRAGVGVTCRHRAVCGSVPEPRTERFCRRRFLVGGDVHVDWGLRRDHEAYERLRTNFALNPRYST